MFYNSNLDYNNHFIKIYNIEFANPIKRFIQLNEYNYDTYCTGDEKMLGWKSKLKANLPKYFYIPAIKNVADDLKNTKSSALGELIGWLSNSVSKEIKEEFTYLQ